MSMRRALSKLRASAATPSRRASAGRADPPGAGARDPWV